MALAESETSADEKRFDPATGSRAKTRTRAPATTSDADIDAAVRVLRDPATIRARCHAIAAAVDAGQSPHFAIDRAQLASIAHRVAKLTRSRFPDLDIPYHSRWRHFEAGGVDRKDTLDTLLAGRSVEEIARSRIELTLISVLLDAGAGPQWRYIEYPMVAQRYARSEGLAVASFRAFVNGRFSSDADDPYRVDAKALMALDSPMLAAMFQASPGNPLVGLDGRVALLRRLGEVLHEQPTLFGLDGRPGMIFDALVAKSTMSAAHGARPAAHGARPAAHNARPAAHGAPPATPGARSGARDARSATPEARAGAQNARSTDQSRVPGPAEPTLSAADILGMLLDAFSSIWPSGQAFEGRPVGDVWPHPDAGGTGPSAGLVPFHKLSQWLTYSLLEPFEWAGYTVTDLDALTGLPEYRNGGLLLDAGLLVPHKPRKTTKPMTPADPWIVEWRALTVALLDDLAPLVREALGVSSTALPVACILEGGTWSAGRAIAAELRKGGPPPVTVDSDGTVF